MRRKMLRDFFYLLGKFLYGVRVFNKSSEMRILHPIGLIMFIIVFPFFLRYREDYEKIPDYLKSFCIW